MVRIGVGLEWVARSLSMSFISHGLENILLAMGLNHTSHRQPK
jgi:hypothetical protein